MPAVAKSSRELSPLDEETQAKKDMEASSIPQSTPDDVSSTVVPIGMCILTSRTSARETKIRGDEDRMATTGINSFYFKNGSLSSDTFQVFPKLIPHLEGQLLSLKEEGFPVCVEVKGYQQRKETKCNKREKDILKGTSLLIERWIIQTLPKRTTGNTVTTTMQFLGQAVQSFLHFSQISSWTVSHGGNLPFDLAYRMYTIQGHRERDSFTLCSPETHVFPLADLSSQKYLQVSVEYLPRLDQIPSILLPPHFFHTATARDAPGLLTQSEEFGAPWSGSQTSVSRKMSQVSISTGAEQHVVAGKSNDITRAHQTSPSKDIHRTGRMDVPPRARTEGFPFSPPLPSPLSPKLLSGLSDRQTCSTNRSTLDQQRLTRSFDSTLALPTSSLVRTSDGAVSLPKNCDSPSASASGNGSFLLLSASNGNGVKRTAKTSNQSPSLSRRPAHCIGKSFRSVSTSASSFSSTWMNGVRPPGASSPIPFLLRQRTNNSNRPVSSQDLKRFNRRSCGSDIQAPLQPPPIRSMSLPANMPNLCLLGSFEESVLNGRLEPCGYVEGFSAELGASGSFCPHHILLPVTAAYFNLSDDGGPSPYLGHIDLSQVKKRGYHVPKKGTVQLTLFNPNKTVVKIFVVRYDHSDMPPSSSTFIRQKNLSKPSHPTSAKAVLPSLHYLIHLRFLCSNSGRVYLHTDIKLIFAQRAPDTDPDMSKVSLYVLTEGPTNPKYGPLNPD